MTVKKINQQIFTSVLIVFLITILLLSLFFVFMYISSFQHNEIINIYYKNLDSYNYDFKLILKNNFFNVNTFYAFQYGALGCLGVAILLPILYAYSGKKNVSYYQRKYLAATWLITSFLFITIFLFSFSEYEYDKFIKWTQSLYSNPTDNYNILHDYFRFALIQDPKGFSAVLSTLALTEKASTYNWIGQDEVWWMAGLQFIVIIFIFLKVSFKAEKTVANIISFKREEEVLNIRNNFNQGYLKKFLSSLLIPTEFNISLWIILFSLIIFVPQIIYIVKLSVANNSLYYFVHYSFIDASLFPSREFANPSDYYALWHITQNQFVIMYLPIVGLAIVSIMVLAFIFILLTKPNISRFGFLSLYAVYFIFSLLAIVFFLLSQLQLQELVNYWNGNYLNLTRVFAKLTTSSHLEYFWITYYELTTSGILSFAFLTTGSIITLTHIAKIRQKKANIVLNANPNQELKATEQNK